jgi:hypothetical protein
MRAYKPLSVLFVVTLLGLVGWSGATAATPGRSCSVPRGSRVIASDGYAVVIRGKGQYPTYRYCRRPEHRFRLLFSISRPGAPTPVSGPPSLRHLSLIRLRGPYVMFAQLDPTGYTVFLWDLRKSWLSGSTGAQPPAVASPSTILLSPTGVAAWIAPGDDIDKQGAFETLDVLSGTSSLATLDNGGQYESAVLGNLALYRCADGCAPNATVVAWTHMTPAGIEQKYDTIGG